MNCETMIIVLFWPLDNCSVKIFNTCEPDIIISTVVIIRLLGAKYSNLLFK